MASSADAALVASARNARLSRASLVAVGPVRAGAEDLGAELLRRLLARRGPRVLDLTRGELLRVRVERRSGDDNLVFEGPLTSVAWAARLGAATHLLLCDGVTVDAYSATTRTTVQYDPAVLEAYTRDRSRAVEGCTASRTQVEREMPTFTQAFEQADEEYRRTRPIVQFGVDRSRDEAAERYRDVVALFTARREECATIEARLPTAEALRTNAPRGENAEARMRASGVFRLLEVPGGEVLWTATITRDGRDASVAVASLLEAALDALPGVARGTPSPADDRPDTPEVTVANANATPTPSAPEASRRRRHRERNR